MRFRIILFVLLICDGDRCKSLIKCASVSGGDRSPQMNHKLAVAPSLIEEIKTLEDNLHRLEKYVLELEGNLQNTKADTKYNGLVQSDGADSKDLGNVHPYLPQNGDSSMLPYLLKSKKLLSCNDISSIPEPSSETKFGHRAAAFHEPIAADNEGSHGTACSDPQLIHNSKIGDKTESFHEPIAADNEGSNRPAFSNPQLIHNSKIGDKTEAFHEPIAADNEESHGPAFSDPQLIHNSKIGDKTEAFHEPIAADNEGSHGPVFSNPQLIDNSKIRDKTEAFHEPIAPDNEESHGPAFSNPQLIHNSKIGDKTEAFHEPIAADNEESHGPAFSNPQLIDNSKIGDKTEAFHEPISGDNEGSHGSAFSDPQLIHNCKIGDKTEAFHEPIAADNEGSHRPACSDPQLIHNCQVGDKSVPFQYLLADNNERFRGPVFGDNKMPSYGLFGDNKGSISEGANNKVDSWPYGDNLKPINQAVFGETKGSFLTPLVEDKKLVFQETVLRDDKVGLHRPFNTQHLNSYLEPVFGKKSVVGKSPIHENFISDKNGALQSALNDERKVEPFSNGLLSGDARREHRCTLADKQLFQEPNINDKVQFCGSLSNEAMKSMIVPSRQTLDDFLAALVRDKRPFNEPSASNSRDYYTASLDEKQEAHNTPKETDKPTYKSGAIENRKLPFHETGSLKQAFHGPDVGEQKMPNEPAMFNEKTEAMSDQNLALFGPVANENQLITFHSPLVLVGDQKKAFHGHSHHNHAHHHMSCQQHSFNRNQRHHKGLRNAANLRHTAAKKKAPKVANSPNHHVPHLKLKIHEPHGKENCTKNL